MKNIIRKLNILIVTIILFVPVFVNAQWYGDDYSYSNSAGWYGDDYSYSNSAGWYGDEYYYADNSGWYGDEYYYADNSGWYGDEYYYDDDYYHEEPVYYSYDDYYGYEYEDYYGYEYEDYYGYDVGCYYGCDRDRDVVVIRDRDDLDVTCEVSDTRVEKGETVIYTADVDGGSGNIRYDWDGDIRSSSQSVRTRYNREGDYEVQITVRDSRGNVATDSCPVVIVEEDEEDDDDFDIKCEISDTRIEEGDRVRIEVDIDGGNSPFDIKWSGDADEIDDFDDDRKSQYVRVDDEGTYRLRVTVEDDDGNRETDTCTLYVEDEERDRAVYSYAVNEYPTGTYSSVDSVFLNQVPYTGPVDTLKGIGFVALVLAWSFAIAYSIRKKIKKTQNSKKIAEFKEMNKQAQNI